MAQNKKTLYEALGVPRNAKNTDIGLAYNRFKAAMQKEDAAPDPRGAAMAKAAFETLSDPERRAQYDASLEPAPVAKSRNPILIGTVLFLAAAAGLAFVLIDRHPKPAAAAPLDAQQLLDATSPSIGRLRVAVMSGEVRPAGVAIATGAGELATTCHEFPAGAQITINLPEGASQASIARANEDLDICILGVKSPPARFVKLRSGEPAAGEKVYAILAEGARPDQLKEGRVKRAIADPKGAAMELEFPGASLPTGSPVVDSQGRLVGLITTPHSFGEGLVVAYGAGRIEQARADAPKAGL
jgi:hypothetical protein